MPDICDRPFEDVRDLYEAADFQRIALDAAELGTWKVNLAELQVWGDQRCCAIYGISETVQTLENFFQRIHPEDRDKVADQVKAAMDPASAGTFSSEHRIVWPDSSLHWVLSKGQVYFEGNVGEMRAIRIVGVVQDITDRKLVEAALHDTEERLLRALEGARLGTWEWDVAARVMRWDVRSKELLGVAPDFPVTDEWHVEHIHPDDRMAVFQSAATALLNHTFFILDYRVLWPDGSLKWVMSMGRGYYNPDGTPYQMAGTLLDITDRKNAEEELEKAAEKTQLALDAAEMGTWDYEIATRSMYGDERCRAMHGVTDLVITPEQFVDLIHPEDQPAVVRAFLDALSPGSEGKYAVEYRVILRDGSLAWIASKGQVFSQGEGENRYAARFIGTVTDITRQKQAQEALRASEGRFRSIFDATQDAIIMVDDSGICVESNPAAKRIFGCQKASWIGSSLFGYLKFDIEWGDFLKKGCFQHPLKFERNDGQVIDVEAYGIAAIVPGRHLFVFHDVTERESLLRDHETQRTFLDQLIEAAPTGIVVLAPPEFRIILANPYFKALTGLPDDKETVGETIENLLPVLRNQFDFSNLKTAFQTGEPVIITEAPADLGAGREQTWWNARYVPLKTREGIVDRIILLVDEVTEQVLARKQLAESEERLMLATEGTGIGTFDFNPESGKLFWGARAREIFGLPQGVDVNYRLFLNLIHPENRGDVIEAIKEAMDPQGSGNYACDYRIMRVDGRVRWINARGKVFFNMINGSRRPVRFVGTMLDITEQKRMDMALRDSEARERSRVAELKKLAEDLARSNRDLEQFAYVASHDLKEPLRQITGFTELLERRYRTQLDKDAEEYLEFIAEGSRRMQDLITDLLAYSRVGKGERQVSQINLQEVIDRALLNLQTSINESDASITEDPMPIVRAEASQLVQVFQNLIGNALKFRGEKKPIIHLGVRRENSMWLFSVSDNGIGFRPENADTIFQLFQRLHARSKYEGTGIGLAICKRIIEMHGGTIWAESQPGKGSVFYFTLPVA